MENELGYAHLLEHLILKGAKNFSSPFKIGYAADRAGASLNAQTGPELINIHIEVAKHKWKEMFKLLCDIILNPIFPKEVFDNEKKVVLQEIKRTYDNPAAYLWIKTIKNIFENHPLSHDVLGDEEIITNASVEDLVAYRDRFFHPKSIVLIANGAINSDELIKLTKEQFAGFVGGKDTSLSENYSNPKIKHGIGFENFKSNQSYLNFNFVGPKMNFKDFLTLQLIANFLGSLRTSVLYQELRQRQGLVYNVNSYSVCYQDASLFQIATSSSFPDKIIPIVTEKILRLENYFPESVLEEYRDQYINILIRKLSNPMAEIKFLAQNWFLYGDVLTLNDVEAIIKTINYNHIIEVKNKHLTSDKLFIMQLGKTQINPD